MGNKGAKKSYEKQPPPNDSKDMPEPQDHVEESKN